MEYKGLLFIKLYIDWVNTICSTHQMTDNTICSTHQMMDNTIALYI